MGDGADPTDGPGLGRRILGALLWSLVAVLAPFVGGVGAVGLAKLGDASANLADKIGPGALAGLAVGVVAGVRSRRLLGLILAPPLGLFVGLTDFWSFGWLLEGNHISTTTATYLPVWGALGGLVAGLSTRRPIPIVLAPVLGGAADLGGRWLFYRWATEVYEWWPEAYSIIGEAQHVPAAIVIVLLAARGIDAVSADETASDAAPAAPTAVATAAEG